MTGWRWPLAALLLALAALLPLRLVLPADGLAARAVSGTVWSGRLTQAEWRGLPLGDVALRADPAALLTGRWRYFMAGDGLSGQVWQGRGAGASGLVGHLPLAGALDLPIAAIDLADVGLEWRDGGCQSASGEVRVVPAGLLRRLGLLSGRPRCAGGRLLLPLASADGRSTLALTIDDRGWQARLGLSGSDPAETAALLAGGFAPGPTGPVLERKGSW